jgi:hypothetical protein
MKKEAKQAKSQTLTTLNGKFLSLEVKEREGAKLNRSDDTEAMIVWSDKIKKDLTELGVGENVQCAEVMRYRLNNEKGSQNLCDL